MGARFPDEEGTSICQAVSRPCRVFLLGARNRERVRSGSSAPTTRPAAGALAAKILQEPASCARGARAAFVFRRTFSSASSRCRNVPRGTESQPRLGLKPPPRRALRQTIVAIVAPVRITSIGLHDGAKLDLPAHPLLYCSFAGQLGAGRPEAASAAFD